MDGNPDKERRARLYLRKLGNPYAADQIEGLPESPATTQAVGESAQSRAVAPQQVELFGKTSATSVPPAERSGNPYASLASDVAEFTDEGERVVKRCDTAATSAAEFESTCRRIFAFYIPALERGRLRAEHRDFISRNRSRSGRVRYRLLQALRRYDLSDILGIQPQFNRESDLLTLQKLKEIERSIGEDE